MKQLFKDEWPFLIFVAIAVLVVFGLGAMAALTQGDEQQECRNQGRVVVELGPSEWRCEAP